MNRMWTGAVRAAVACSIGFPLATPPRCDMSESDSSPTFSGQSFDALKLKRKKYRADNLMLVAGSGHPKLAEEISSLLKVPLADASISRFADGEVHIKIAEQVRGKDIFYIQSCAAPSSDNIVELLLFISACRRSGAKRVTAVVPVSNPESS